LNTQEIMELTFVYIKLLAPSILVISVVIVAEDLVTLVKKSVAFKSKQDY
jgi:hypothetical protein